MRPSPIVSISLAIAATLGVAARPATASTEPAPAAVDDWVLIERYVPQDDLLLKNLFVAHLDGSDEQPLLEVPVGEAVHVVHADWSPDGQWVAFEVLESSGDAPAAAVWIVGADGRNPQQVVQCSVDSCQQYAYPEWSPDGSELAMIRFNAYSDGTCCTSDLVVVDVSITESGEWMAGDDEIVTSFTEADAVDTYDSFHNPAWSSDGEHLAYTVEQYGFEDPYPFLGTRIAVVDRAGGDAEFITPLELQAGDPDWHPCADLIAFSTYPLSSFQESTAPGNLYTIRPDGTEMAQLTDESVDGSLRFGAAHWTPDGTGLLLTIARASGGVRLDSVELATLPAGGGTVTGLGVAGTASIRPSADDVCAV